MDVDVADRIVRRRGLQEARDQARAQRKAGKLADKLLNQLASKRVLQDGRAVRVTVSTRMTPGMVRRVRPLMLPLLREKLPRECHVNRVGMEDETWDLATCTEFFGCLLGAWPVFFFRLLRVHVELEGTVSK